LYSKHYIDKVQISRMDALQIIRDFLSEQYGIAPETITPETPLDKVGIDSLMFFDLVFEFEAKLGIRAPNEEITDLKTIGELIALVDKLKSEKK
jgi:acyl carrier protein